MKKIKKYGIICVILIIIIGFISYYKIPKFKKLYDDILFFKKFEKLETKQQQELLKETKHKQYIFEVTSNEIEFQHIDLIDSLKKESFLNGMLEPGAEGIFDIVITTNINTKYQVNFQSLNMKPKNLKFENLENKNITNSIEELAIEGILQKNDKKIITIRWYWDYENSKEGNLQDTLDSKNIENYSFNIYAVGEQRG